jgi:hypothetical protein
MKDPHLCDFSTGFSVDRSKDPRFTQPIAFWLCCWHHCFTVKPGRLVSPEISIALVETLSDIRMVVDLPEETRVNPLIFA